MLFHDSSEDEAPGDGLVEILNHAKTCGCEKCEDIRHAAPHIAAIRQLRNALCGQLDLNDSPHNQKPQLESGMHFVNAMLLECASMIDALIQVKDNAAIVSRPPILYAMFAAAKLAMVGNCDPELRAKIEESGEFSFTEVGGDDEEELPDPVDMNEHKGKNKPKFINRFGGPPSLN